jgi:hypothetical protein
MAIPITAIKRVERVNFELPFKKGEKEKHQLYIENQFEVHLKSDFLEYFLKPEYESRLLEQAHSHSS